MIWPRAGSQKQVTSLCSRPCPHIPALPHWWQPAAELAKARESQDPLLTLRGYIPFWKTSSYASIVCFFLFWWKMISGSGRAAGLPTRPHHLPSSTHTVTACRCCAPSTVGSQLSAVGTAQSQPLCTPCPARGSRCLCGCIHPLLLAGCWRPLCTEARQ